jgi:hypothetical protein
MPNYTKQWLGRFTGGVFHITIGQAKATLILTKRYMVLNKKLQTMRNFALAQSSNSL